MVYGSHATWQGISLLRIPVRTAQRNMEPFLQHPLRAVSVRAKTVQLCNEELLDSAMVHLGLVFQVRPLHKAVPLAVGRFGKEGRG